MRKFRYSIPWIRRCRPIYGLQFWSKGFFWLEISYKFEKWSFFDAKSTLMIILMLICGDDGILNVDMIRRLYNVIKGLVDQK